MAMELVYKKLDEDVVRRINALFPSQNCFIDVMPGNVVLPQKYKEIGAAIRELDVYEDDIWTVSYPRTGSTWTQEMVWLLANNLDFETGKSKLLALRSPIIELSALFSEDHHQWVAASIGNSVDSVRKMVRPRLARSHLPFDLLPESFESVKPRIIYTARNPKDLCVSYYHYCKLIHGLHGTFEEFVELFLDGRTPIGSYWKHVLPFWKRSQNSNVLFIKYEDMNRDLASVVRKCAHFLKVDYLLTAQNMVRICEHLNFENMKTNSSVNLESILKNMKNDDDSGIKKGTNFIRNGKTGDWKHYMTENVSKRFDEWIDQNTRGSGLVFDYE